MDNIDGKRGWPKNKYFMCRIIAMPKTEDGSIIGTYMCGFLGYIRYSDSGSSYNDIIVYPAKRNLMEVSGVSTHEEMTGTQPYPEPWNIDVTFAFNDNVIKEYAVGIEYQVFYKLI